MSFSLIPNIIIKELTDLTPQMLEEHGICFLMMDFDNTIVPYTTNTPTRKMQAWLEMMKDSSVGLCVVSNSKRPRVVEFCKTYGLACVTHAKKPFQRGIREAMDTYQLEEKTSALVGDQIYTDVLGANCANIQSILVKAIDNHTIWLKLRHVLELPFIAWGKRRIAREKSGKV